MSFDPVWVTVWATIVMAFAACGSFAVAVLLWKVTSKYTAETEKIAEANDKMAAANERLLEEMREDRKVTQRRASQDAAQRLQVALARAHRRWQHVDLEDREAFRDIYNDFLEAVAVDRNALLTEALRDDVTRFTGIFETVVVDWDTVLSVIEDEQGEKVGRTRRQLDNRTYRLNWAAGRLREVMGAHQRGDDYVDPRLPRSSWDFWKLPSPASDDELAALADE